jgi:hypothetical protein
MATAWSATTDDLTCYFSTGIAPAGSASASGFSAAVPVDPSSPWFRLHRLRANVVSAPTKVVENRR